MCFDLFLSTSTLGICVHPGPSSSIRRKLTQVNTSLFLLFPAPTHVCTCAQTHTRTHTHWSHHTYPISKQPVPWGNETRKPRQTPDRAVIPLRDCGQASMQDAQRSGVGAPAFREHQWCLPLGSFLSSRLLTLPPKSHGLWQLMYLWGPITDGLVSSPTLDGAAVTLRKPYTLLLTWARPPVSWGRRWTVDSFAPDALSNFFRPSSSVMSSKRFCFLFNSTHL